MPNISSPTIRLVGYRPAKGGWVLIYEYLIDAAPYKLRRKYTTTKGA